MIESDRELLMVQLHAYAACEDETIRECVRNRYARLVRHVLELSAATPEQVDQFMSVGMWLNVQAAMGVGDLNARVRLDPRRTRRRGCAARRPVLTRPNRRHCRRSALSPPAASDEIVEDDLVASAGRDDLPIAPTKRTF